MGGFAPHKKVLVEHTHTYKDDDLPVIELLIISLIFSLGVYLATATGTRTRGMKTTLDTSAVSL